MFLSQDSRQPNVESYGFWILRDIRPPKVHDESRVRCVVTSLSVKPVPILADRSWWVSKRCLSLIFHGGRKSRKGIVMSNQPVKSLGRPMNVAASHGTAAAHGARTRGGLPGVPVLTPEVLAPGLPRTAAHNLIFHGGKTLASLTFTNFYIAGDTAWAAADMQNIDNALSAAMSDRRLNNVMAQYFPNQVLANHFKPSRKVPVPAPAAFTQGDTEAMIADLFNQGKLTGFDLGATVFNLMLPPGTVLNTDLNRTMSVIAHAQAAHGAHPAAGVNPVHADAEDSTNGLGGYHGSVHVGGKTLYYAVGVFSQVLPDGTRNGIPVFDQPWKNVVATFYHELQEARTDADVEDAIKAGNDPNGARFLGWTSAQGEEIGDFPVFEANPLTLVFKEVPLADGSGTVPIQFMYSNAVNGPEGPIDTPHASAVHGHPHH